VVSGLDVVLFLALGFIACLLVLGAKKLVSKVLPGN
jgi:hypothetical protein